MTLRRLLYFDLETTGKDPWKARVVEASFLPRPIPVPGAAEDLPVDDAAPPTPWSFRCRPPIPVEEEAASVHGMTTESLAEEEPFAVYAEAVQNLVDGAVLVGYNIRRFDTILLHRELVAAGQPGLQTTASKITHPEIDVREVWMRCEPRSLEGALMRFLGGSPKDWEAHSAADDTLVLPMLLGAMQDVLPGLPVDASLEDLMVVGGAPDDEVDRGGKFYRDPEGVVRLAFGKHRDTPASQVPLDYWSWMRSADFPDDTLEIVRHYESKGYARQGGRRR